MRKIVFLSALVFLAMVCSGCSLHEEYREEIHSLKNEIEELESENSSLQEENELYEFCLDEIGRSLEALYPFFDEPQNSEYQEEAWNGFVYALELSGCDY